MTANRKLRTVSLNQVVLRAMELQQPALAQANIQAVVDLDPDLPLVHGDAGRLQQVLLNLTGNARQALEQAGRGGTIRVCTKQIGEERVLLEIADDGPGIPREILGRIFDPFFTTKPVGSGTGLGLAIVLGIVQEHGGHVNVESPTKGGAVFSIALRAAGGRKAAAGILAMPGTTMLSAGMTTTAVPAIHSYGVNALTRENHSEARNSRVLAADGSLRPSSNRILVVEDEPTVARLIADVLEGEGFRVDVVADGSAALKRSESENYDLVICDMKMPGVDGQQFYKALIQAENLLSERFLFVTGDVVSLNTQEFMARHRLPHVAKPFRMEELKERVHELTERFSRSSAAAATRKNG